MTFRSFRKSVYKANQLSDKFAEPVTFEPESGATRIVWMKINVEVIRNENNNSEDYEERATCFMMTDDTDPDKGGVPLLFFGDSITRAAEFDSNAEPFYHSGEVLEHREHYQKAVFVRTGRVVQGPGGN